MKNEQDFFENIYGWTDIEFFPKALSFAQKAHANQKRDEGTPYFEEHIKGVIKILIKELDIQSDTVLAVAALHDVLEDSDMFTYENLCSEFGKTIADGVLLLTKKQDQDIKEYLENIKNASGMSWLIMVKLADRLHNLRCIKYTNNPEKIKRKVQETRMHFLKYSENYPEMNKKILYELAKIEGM